MIRFTRIVALFLLAKPLVGWPIDLQPNDIVAPPPDKTYLMLSYFGTENTTNYRNGAVVSSAPYGNPVINNPNMIIRAARSYMLGDLPSLTYAQLPYGTIQPAGSLVNYPTSTGIGDFTLATAIWPYANRDTRTYFGMAGYLIVPTGSYSSTQPFNVGENRYKTDLQMGFQKPIFGNLDGMVAVDTMWYGGNSQCAAACGSVTKVPLTQKPLTTTQLGPIYKIDQTFTVGASYFYVAGGATSINNVYQNNVINTQRFLLSGLAYTDIGRFSLQYGRDMGIQNGFIQTRVLAIRYMKSF
jgi:Putative MetA-pathway of phenol degradation